MTYDEGPRKKRGDGGLCCKMGPVSREIVSACFDSMIDGFPHRNTIKAAVTTVEVQQDKIAAENPRWVGRSPRSPCLIMFCMFRLHKHMFYRADKVEFLRRQNKSREARMPTEHENADFLQKRSECFFQPCCNLFSWHHDACSYCFSLFILWQLTENC